MLVWLLVWPRVPLRYGLAVRVWEIEGVAVCEADAEADDDGLPLFVALPVVAEAFPDVVAVTESELPEMPPATTAVLVFRPVLPPWAADPAVPPFAEPLVLVALLLPELPPVPEVAAAFA